MTESEHWGWSQKCCNQYNFCCDVLETFECARGNTPENMGRQPGGLVLQLSPQRTLRASRPLLSIKGTGHASQRTSHFYHLKHDRTSRDAWNQTHKLSNLCSWFHSSYGSVYIQLFLQNRKSKLTISNICAPPFIQITWTIKRFGLSRVLYRGWNHPIGCI